MSILYRSLLGVLIVLFIITSAYADRIGILSQDNDTSETYVYKIIFPNDSWSVANGIGTLDLSSLGGGNVSVSGTPSQYDWATWTNSTTVKGVTVTGSKVVCTDANGEPVACSNLTDLAFSDYVAIESINTAAELETVSNLGAYASDILAATSEGNFKSIVNLEIGTDVEAHDTTLTDIADGTIAENLVNTTNPWADNEVADNITITNLSQVQDITIAAASLNALDDGLTTQILVGGGAGVVPVWGTDLPTAVTIGSAYIYRAGGTDVSDADVANDITITNISQVQDITATAAEINYTTDVTSLIQAQLDARALESVVGTSLNADDLELNGTVLQTAAEIPHTDVAETLTQPWDLAGSDCDSCTGIPLDSDFGANEGLMYGTGTLGSYGIITTLDLSISGGTQDNVITLNSSAKFQEANPEDVLANGESGRGDVSWANGDYFTTGTTGGSADIDCQNTPTGYYHYKLVDDICYVTLKVACDDVGASADGALKLQLPYTSKNTSGHDVFILQIVEDNGTKQTGRYYVGSNTNQIVFGDSISAGGGFTTTDGQSWAVWADFFYRVN